MGGKSHADNQQLVDEQKKQAADAAKKEADRQARLKQGLTSIDQAFGGKPILAKTTANFDWKKFTPKSVLPTGYTRAYVDAQGNILKDQAATAGRYTSGSTGSSDPGSPIPAYYTPGKAAVSAANLPGATLALIDAKGNVVKTGTPITYTYNKDTGKRSSGFDNKFYNNYGQSIMDYYNPQIAEQYGAAQKELTYRLARVGSGQSSAGNEETVRLAEQNTQNLAGIANKADTAKGDLRAKIAAEKQKATSQLYATENPDVAANQATAAVRDITLQQPDMSPLAQLFNIAAVGGTQLARNYNNQNLIGNFNASIAPNASRNITS